MSQKIDLNLFRVFEAVMKHRGVSLASSELCLSPSAISHALARLREVLEDPLFVATANGMEPTARAIELGPHVRAGLERIDAALSSKLFDPAVAHRVFRIAASDYGTVSVLPRLVARLHSEAPHVDLRVFPFNRLDTVRHLDDGRLDIAISWFSDLPARMRRQAVLHDIEALVVRRDHPLVGRPVSKEELLAFPHVVVELTGSASDVDVEGYIDDRGVTRRVWIERLLLDLRSDGPLVGRAAISVPHYASVIPIIEASDMIATLPRSLALRAARHGDIALLELPYSPLHASLEAIWHERSDDDDGVQWLLAQMHA